MKHNIGVRLALFKLLLLVMGIAMIALSFGDALAIWKKDFGKVYDKGRMDYQEDQLVTGKIEYVFDPIATLESSQKVYGISVSKKMTPYYLCVIPYNETTGKDGYYIIVHATDDDTIKSMDSLISHTYFAVEHPDEEVTSNAKPVALETKTRPIPDEVMDYAIEYMNNGQTSEAEIKSLMCDMMLEEIDYGTKKYEPLLGLLVALIPVVWVLISRKRARAYKSSRTHYVNQGPRDDYNSAPVGRDGQPVQPMRRYSADAYEAHTYAGGISPQQGGIPQQPPTGRRYDPSAYGGNGDYQPGEMDSIDTTDLKL
ncbi:hypothetical protein [Ruminococcus sp.]|uniref:DUF6709 family protein n=1 Tax=Ruminococcus sp. TaxID=41978 RepID=UPI0025D24DE0|nr:hypothetical protein [Ruminococcus sp.]MBQ8965456.1 hypothetical protein [Ruminococcus sp.]